MIAQNKPSKFVVRILRQDGPSQPPYWQAFDVDYKPNLNIISVLQLIAANPVTQSGEKVEPVAWDCGCLEEVCGACTMVINGFVRQSCSTLVDELLADGSTEMTLEPMSKFPVVRDLFVDRRRMFEALKQVKGWVPTDGMYDMGAGPQESQEEQSLRYALSRCMTCGCCLEACPQYVREDDESQWDKQFIGPHAIGQAVYFNEHETGSKLKAERLEAMMGPGGVSECGNAQNCVKVCPKEVPLVDAIARIGRQTTVYAIKRFFVGR